MSSEHVEGNVNDEDGANKFKGGAMTTDVNTSEVATMASPHESAQRRNHRLSQKVLPTHPRHGRWSFDRKRCRRSQSYQLLASQWRWNCDDLTVLTPRVTG